jgi:hypothetical protein
MLKKIKKNNMILFFIFFKARCAPKEGEAKEKIIFSLGLLAFFKKKIKNKK